MKRSLQRDLNRWVLSATAVFALLAGLASARVAFEDARELQDNQLQQIATLFSTRTNHLIALEDSDPEDTLILQRLGETSPNNLPIPPDLNDGLHTLDMQGESWRVYIYADGHFAASQQTVVRDEVAWDSSLRTLLPILLLAPILMAVVGFAVNRSLEPVRVLAGVVDQHDETRLDALPEQGVPVEIIPFVSSINRLLVRMRQVIAQQQRFVADAAHELRTPVAALSLLTENLANSTSLAEAQARLAPVQDGLARMRNLVVQLLDLARLQGEKTAESQPVAFQKIVTEAIADCYPLAETKGIDLGMPRCEALTVMDVGGTLGTLVRNAIENAIRYTPEGGVVDVSLFAAEGKAVLQVEDGGCGIPEEELERVFEPFYRVGNNPEPGNGLGLAISQEIALRLGGTIRLANRAQGGLLFEYVQRLV